ncbi:MAG: hypothetical protein M1834_007713 [Cirrosporium novae-zelandiae]|nr:MAG: hypothetical protein M1834_007713 [Cirrosporium novae-zelandiae]
MRPSVFLLVLLACAHEGITYPFSPDQESDIVSRNNIFSPIPHYVKELVVRASDSLSEFNPLEKRRGGGGGSRGGSSSGSSSSGGRSSGSSSSSSSGSSSGRTSSSSNTGGRTSSGSGVRPTYGGGKYYGGGASTPYRSGSRSPSAGISPVFYPALAFGFFPGIWLYGVYSYPYTRPYTIHNETSNRNETLNVTCVCGQYQECGCDDNGNVTFVDSLLGNGSASSQNASLVQVATVNGSKGVYINGTLPNGTTAASSSAARGLRQSILETAGWWGMVVSVLATVMICG